MVTLEPNSGLASDIKLLSTAHEIGRSGIRFGESIPVPITIGSGTWVGAGAAVLAGVTVGSGRIVGAGATSSGTVSRTAFTPAFPRAASAICRPEHGLRKIFNLAPLCL